MSDTVIASGNLATARRTISGVLSQFALLGIDAAIAGSLVTDAGLPARAMDEPDFPISLQQELEICSALVAGLPSGRSIVRVLFEALPRMGIENLGVIGMAMRHAATSLDALKVCLTYPQLTMGHSRMVVRLEVKDIPLSGRATRGSRAMNLAGEDTVASVARIPAISTGENGDGNGGNGNGQ